MHDGQTRVERRDPPFLVKKLHGCTDYGNKSLFLFIRDNMTAQRYMQEVAEEDVLPRLKTFSNSIL